MTERDMQLAIVQHWRSSLVCAAPNYTPAGWWECDVWGVLKSGNWIEWECKRTREDLRADTKKARRVWGPGMMTSEAVTKHSRMIGTDMGPSRFWYVVPESLGLEPHEVPAWAGLAMVRGEPGGRWNAVSIIKPAPSLGQRKAPRREIQLCQRRMWYRYWNCLRAMNRSGIVEPAASEVSA